MLTHWIERSWNAQTYIAFFAQVSLSLPAALGGAWLLGLDAKERIHLRTTLHSLIKSSANLLGWYKNR